MGDERYSGWRAEALGSRKRREEDDRAMRELATLIESWVKGELDEATMLLAFHHVAMDHGAYAGKKTLAKALKSSVEKLSQLAPTIYPPDRIISAAKIQRLSQARKKRTA